MMTDSCEAQVSRSLYAHIVQLSFVSIVNWNPPDAKAYQTINIKFPWFEGQRRRRDSVDAIWISRHILFLVELKCTSSESLKDIEKLLRINEQLGTEQLQTYIERQGTKIPYRVKQTALVIGVRNIDTNIPNTFTFLEIDDEGITPFFGSSVDEKVRSVVQEVCKPT